LSFDLPAYFDKASTAANKVDFSSDCNNNIAFSASSASEIDEQNGLYLKGCAPFSFCSLFFFLNKCYRDVL